MKKMRFLMIFIGFLSVLSVVLAVKVTVFDVDLTSENLTFTGNENITRNWTVYRYANATGATVNLSGIETHVVLTGNTWTLGNFSGSSFPTGIHYNNSEFYLTCAGGCSNTINVYNTSWTWVKNYTLSGTAITNPTDLYFNNSGWFILDPNNNRVVEYDGAFASTGTTYALSGGYPAGLWWNGSNWYVSDQDFVIYEFSGSFINTKNWTLGDNRELQYDSYGNWFVLNYPAIIKETDGNFSLINSWSIGNGGSGLSIYNGLIYVSYEDDTIKEYYYHQYPNNVSLSINNSGIWNFTGRFNQTNNKTNDFKVSLNTALNNGACDCVGCSLTGNNCTIPFIFHSDTAGILQYSDININWLEYTKPNLTIISPNETYTSTTYLPINITAADDSQLDYCFFNVTRGASLEVANTEIANCNTTTFTVSGDATYIFNACVNDTSGNQNCSSTTFKTVNYIPPPSSPSSSGGGGSFIRDIITTETMPEVSSCEPFGPAFNEAFTKAREESFGFESIKILWNAFWDVVLCKSAASIIPI